MTVFFKDKYTGELIHHEEVSYFTADESVFGVQGYGLHFTDATYCFVSSKTFEFVSAHA